MNFKRWLDEFQFPITFQRITNNKGVFAFENVYVNKAFINTFGASSGDHLKDFFSKSTYSVKKLNRDLLSVKQNGGRKIGIFEHKQTGHNYQTELFVAYDDVIFLIFKEMTSQFLQDRNIDILFEYQTEMFWVTDSKGIILRVNDAVTDTLGFEKEAILNKNIAQFVHPDDLDDTLEAVKHLNEGHIIRSFTNRYRSKEGSYRVFEWKAGMHHDMLFASARDVTEWADREKRLSDEASRDPLTGLYNRRYFYDRLNEDTGHPRTLAILDLDHFKLVNDMWGHQVGDRVLINLSKLLTKHTDEAIISRIGGEEFAIIYHQPIDAIRGPLKTLKQIIAQHVFPVVKHITVSIGFAEKQKEETLRAWFKRADDAMYIAKEQGRDALIEATNEIPLISSKYTEWDPAWSSGDPVIDKQHKDLLFLGKQLVYKTYPEKTRAHVKDEVGKIIHEVRDHFNYEEKIMADVDYPALEEHKKIHFDLLNKALHIQTLFETGEVDAMMIFSFLIEDFIMAHLIEEDMKYFDYIQNNKNHASESGGNPS